MYRLFPIRCRLLANFNVDKKTGELTAAKAFSITAETTIFIGIDAPSTDPENRRCLRGGVQLRVELHPPTTTNTTTTTFSAQTTAAAGTETDTVRPATTSVSAERSGSGTPTVKLNESSDGTVKDSDNQPVVTIATTTFAAQTTVAVGTETHTVRPATTSASAERSGSGTPTVKLNESSDGTVKDSDNQPVVTIALVCALVAVCTCASAAWALYFCKSKRLQTPANAALTTFNEAYTHPGNTHDAKEITIEVLPLVAPSPTDDPGCHTPTPSGTPGLPSGGNGGLIPQQVPSASGHDWSLGDPYGLDPRLIRVDKKHQLGKGNYGEVFRGTVLIDGGQDGALNKPAAYYEYQDAASTAIDVAIKMLPQDRPVEERERQDFWEEVKFLRHLQCIGGHDNIIKFVGYVAGEEMMLLLEFAPGGSLVGYLRKRERDDPLPVRHH